MNGECWKRLGNVAKNGIINKRGVASIRNSRVFHNAWIGAVSNFFSKTTKLALRKGWSFLLKESYAFDLDWWKLNEIWEYLFSMYAKFSEKLTFLNPLIVKNICFSENFAYVPDKWSYPKLQVKFCDKKYGSTINEWIK